jgi:hypothetical protein
MINGNNIESKYAIFPADIISRRSGSSKRIIEMKQQQQRHFVLAYCSLLHDDVIGVWLF